MKTTAEAAKELGIKPDKLRRILKTYPSAKPAGKIGHMAVWTDAEILHAGRFVSFDLTGHCPHCGKHPNGDMDPSMVAKAEDTPDAPSE